MADEVLAAAGPDGSGTKTCFLLDRLRGYPEAEEIFWRLHHFNHRTKERIRSHYTYCKKLGDRTFDPSKPNILVQRRLALFVNRAQAVLAAGGGATDLLMLAEKIHDEMPPPAGHPPPLWRREESGADSPRLEPPSAPTRPGPHRFETALGAPRAGEAITVEIEALFREAVACRACFETGRLREALVDLAQPRFIGSEFWSAPRRVVIASVNPGSGQGRTDDADRRLREVLHAYQVGKAGINAVFRHQRDDLHNWGRFWALFIEGLGLSLEQVALVNIAWCADADNSHPTDMLRRCWSKHTRRLLNLLQPDLVLLSGNDAQAFHAEVAAACPNARVEGALHHAHRKGHAATSAEIARLRHTLAEAEAG